MEKKSEAVLELIAHAIGMEDNTELLERWFELYSDALREDVEATEPKVLATLAMPDREFDVRVPERDELVEQDDTLMKPYYTCAEDPRGRRKSEYTDGYRGFLHVKCSKCGDVKTFCAKISTNVHHCHNCGTDTRLNGLALVRTTCNCGKEFTYHTNRVDEWGFDIPCISCGRDMAVEYSTREHCFVSLKKIPKRS